MGAASIRIRKAGESLKTVRAGFLSAWNGGKYKGGHFNCESPAALFRVLMPKRRELIECLQGAGPLGVRALARALGRDVKRVHDDASAMIEIGMAEKAVDGKLVLPFDQVRADFVMKSAA